MLILYPVVLLNSLITQRPFLGCFWRFHEILQPCTCKQPCCISSFLICMHFMYNFSLPGFIGQNSSTILKRMVRAITQYDPRGKEFSLSPLSIIQAIDILQMFFIKLRKNFFYLSIFLRLGRSCNLPKATLVNSRV